mmetsp:Transcript_2406/g.3689  ORF Transcript_2406/g.3689 Transcript_2406/m.3689 type:complete len:184 (+) Transcript_2406:167-718(+)
MGTSSYPNLFIITLQSASQPYCMHVPMSLFQQVNNQCRYIFCYGSLRPDDDSGTPWTKEAISGMTAQPARVWGAKLYEDQYAALVLDDDDNDDETKKKNGVIGWVLTTDDPTFFREKLELFDYIERYKEDGTGFYQRAIVDACLEEEDVCIGPNGSNIVRAYVYHRPDCSKEQRITSGDWLQR